MTIEKAITWSGGARDWGIGDGLGHTRHALSAAHADIPINRPY